MRWWWWHWYCEGARGGGGGVVVGVVVDGGGKRRKELRIHHDLPAIDGEFGVVEGPVEAFAGLWFVRRVVVRSEVFVGQSLDSAGSCSGIKDEHFLNQIDS